MADVFPRVRREHEGGVLDLIVDVLVVVERERAAQADVDDDSHRPHIQGPVVALVTEHLRRCGDKTESNVARKHSHRTRETQTLST